MPKVNKFYHKKRTLYSVTAKKIIKKKKLFLQYKNSNGSSIHDDKLLQGTTHYDQSNNYS